MRTDPVNPDYMPVYFLLPHSQCLFIYSQVAVGTLAVTEADPELVNFSPDQTVPILYVKINGADPSASVKEIICG